MAVRADQSHGLRQAEWREARLQGVDRLPDGRPRVARIDDVEPDDPHAVGPKAGRPVEEDPEMATLRVTERGGGAEADREIAHIVGAIARGRGARLDPHPGASYDRRRRSSPLRRAVADLRWRNHTRASSSNISGAVRASRR